MPVNKKPMRPASPRHAAKEVMLVRLKSWKGVTKPLYKEPSVVEFLNTPSLYTTIVTAPDRITRLKMQEYATLAFQSGMF